MTKIKTIAFLPLLISTIVALVVVCAEGVFTFNMNAVGPVQYPGDEEWQNIIRTHQNEIVDGSTEAEFLNACYEGGWRKCLANFESGHDLWDYQEVLNRKPELLSGNMTDTDRVAGNAGWNDASNAIRKRLDFENPEIIKGRVHYVNRKLVFLVPLVALSAIGAVIGYYRRRK